MTQAIAHRLQQVKMSPTMLISAKAAELRAAGRDIISLSAGEPDFHTPQPIKQAGQQAIANDFTRYTAVDGIPTLKNAIIKKFKRDNQLEYQASQILVSCGAKHSLYNAHQALLNPNDEVIIPAPYWVSYVDMALLAEAKPIIIKAEQSQNFKITPEQLTAAITEKTKLFILCSPSNPSGMVYSHQELQALADVLLQHPQITILSDDIYEHIHWADEPFRNIVMQCPALYERTIVINGVSKAYAMTGWRIGYAAGPANVIAAMKTIQSQSTSNPSSISQMAAQAALDGEQDCVAAMVRQYQQRQILALGLLNAIPGFHCQKPQGAFYLFPEVSQVIRHLDLKDDIALAEFLLEQAEVAVVPGAAFGLANHIRLSYATSEELLEKALRRIMLVQRQAR